MPDPRAGYYGPRLAAWFEGEVLDHALHQMASDGGRLQTSFTKSHTPTDTGHLRESIKQLPVMHYSEGTRDVYESGCETTVDYAPYVEHGTGLWGPRHAPYVIRPKRPGGWLRFVDKGKVVFARQVLHPGSPGSHMFERGARDTEASFGMFIRPAAEAWARQQERNDTEVHYPGARP